MLGAWFGLHFGAHRWQCRRDAAMDDAMVKQAVDDLANALQAAVLVVTRLESHTAAAADETATLRQALRRATQTLHRLQPR